MRIQLWSFHYHPEPTGIGPVSRVFADGLARRGHDVSVVAAHPHYPKPMWQTGRRPYRERQGSVEVLRLPLWVGRKTAAERYRQELSFVGSLAAATPALGSPDVLVSVSPSFPALLPALANVRTRALPWILWLQDLLPDGAASAGIVDESSRVLRMSRRLELAAYERADRIAVISEAFTANLEAKGVPSTKIDLIYNPATRTPPKTTQRPKATGRPRILSMGNIGHSQGLAPLVAAFERSEEMKRIGAELVITGTGVAAEDVAAEVRSDRVRLLGVVDDVLLERELRECSVALVSQRYAGAEFNFPSKLMNFMAYGLPVIGVVDPASEVARVVEQAQAGWIVDSADPDAFPTLLAEILGNQAILASRGAASRAFAAAHFLEDGFTTRFETMLERVVRESSVGEMV